MQSKLSVASGLAVYGVVCPLPTRDWPGRAELVNRYPFVFFSVFITHSLFAYYRCTHMPVSCCFVLFRCTLSHLCPICNPGVGGEITTFHPVKIFFFTHTAESTQVFLFLHMFCNIPPPPFFFFLCYELCRPKSILLYFLL